MSIDIFYKYVNLLNKELKESLTFYTSDYYKEINSKSIYNNTIKRHFDNINNIFDGAPHMNSTMTVYRGMKKEYKDDNDNQTTFISTSKNRKRAEEFMMVNCCLYIITLTPGNYSILPLENVSEHPDEEEILLPNGLLSIQKREIVNGNDIFYCTYIPKDAKIINIEELKENNLKDKIELSTTVWVDRIFSSGIKDEIELLCDSDENIDNCINDLLKTLSFYDEIPDEAKYKFISLISNVKDKLNNS